MYKYILTPFLIAISTPLSAKIYDGLEVKGDHRVLSLLVEEIEDNFESLTKVHFLIDSYYITWHQ